MPTFILNPTVQSTILAVIDSSSESERLVLTLIPPNGFGRESHLELQRQTWSESLGWFTQMRVEISKEEVSGLRSALGTVRSGKPEKSFASREPSILAFPA